MSENCQSTFRKSTLHSKRDPKLLYTFTCRFRRVSISLQVSRRLRTPLLKTNSFKNPGVVSNYLHDSVNEGDMLKVGPPCGEFTLDPTNASSQPTVLIAGDIGITPLLAMAKALIHVAPDAPLFILQADCSSETHVFRSELEELAAKATQLKTHTIYDSPLANDVDSKLCDSVGFTTKELLANLAPVANAEFPFRGPSYSWITYTPA